MKEMMTSRIKVFALLGIMLLLPALMRAQNANLVLNGDFSNGATGFSSEYVNDYNLSAAGRFYVSDNANQHNSDFYLPSEFSNTSVSGGKFMIVNGSDTPNCLVWSETLTVQPNSIYEFSMSATHLSKLLLQMFQSELKVSVNGSAIGTLQLTNEELGNWQGFDTVNWSSGAATSVEIKIIDTKTYSSGNGRDFGIDDILFRLALGITPKDDDSNVCSDGEITVNPLSNDSLNRHGVMSSMAGYGLVPIVTVNPAHGTANASANGIHYVPSPGYSGMDSLQYRVAFETLSASAWIHFNVVATQYSQDAVSTCEDTFYLTGYPEPITEDGDYPVTLMSVLTGCDSIVTYHVTFLGSRDFSILGYQQIFPAMSFWPGNYVYYVSDSLGLVDAPVWTLQPELWEMTVSPSGCKCTIHVDTYGEAALSVYSDFGDCQMTDTLMLNSTHYAVDERDAVQVLVYPNPASNDLHITSASITEVRVFTVLGQLVKSVECDGADELTISLGDLQSAMYFVELLTQNGRATRRITVQR